MRTRGAARLETSVELEPGDPPLYLTNEDGNRFRVREVSFDVSSAERTDRGKAYARGPAIKVDGTEGYVDRTKRNVDLDELPQPVLAGLLRAVRL